MQFSWKLVLFLMQVATIIEAKPTDLETSEETERLAVLRSLFELDETQNKFNWSSYDIGFADKTTSDHVDQETKFEFPLVALENEPDNNESTREPQQFTTDKDNSNKEANFEYSDDAKTETSASPEKGNRD